LRTYILKVQGMLTSAFNSADKLRLRLRSERLLTQPPEQFQSEIALKKVRSQPEHLPLEMLWHDRQKGCLSAFRARIFLKILAVQIPRLIRKLLCYCISSRACRYGRGSLIAKIMTNMGIRANKNMKCRSSRGSIAPKRLPCTALAFFYSTEHILKLGA